VSAEYQRLTAVCREQVLAEKKHIFGKINETSTTLHTTITTALKSLVVTLEANMLQTNERTWDAVDVALDRLDKVAVNAAPPPPPLVRVNIAPEQLAKVDRFLLQCSGVFDKECLETFHALMKFYKQNTQA